MLLDRDELKVFPGGYRMHEYIIARLSLKSIGAPNLQATWFALVTLGSAYYGNSEIKAQTTAFHLTDIEGCQGVFDMWRRLTASGRYDQSYTDFLMSYLRDRSVLSLEFHVQDDAISEFFVTLGKTRLQGCFPKELNLLETHFGTTLTQSED